MSAVFMELPRVGRAELLTERSCRHIALDAALTAPGFGHCWVWGTWPHVPSGCSCPSLCTCPCRGGHWGTAVCVCHQPVSQRDVCRAILVLLHPSACVAVPSPWLSIFPAILGLGRRAQLAGGDQCCVQGRGCWPWKAPSAFEMSLLSSRLSACPPLSWQEYRGSQDFPSLLRSLKLALLLPLSSCVYHILGSVGMECTRRVVNEGKSSRIGKNNLTELPC